MPATYYDLELGADGALSWTASATAPNPMPQAAEALLGRIRGVLDRIRLHIAEGPARTAYSNYVLAVGRTGLQDGNIQTANDELDALNQVGLQVQYYAASLDADQNFHLSAPPWAPNPIPDEVTAFSARVDKAITKVKQLINGPQQVEKRAQYLRMLISYAVRGLAEGDIKSANAALDQFETQFVDEEGPAFRSKYVVSTLWTAIWAFVVVVVLGIIYKLVTANFPGLIPLDPDLVPTVICVALGICLGISFFAFVRNLNLTFDILGHFDSANLSSILRFALVGIIAVILCILLKSGLVTIEIASVKFNEFMTNRLTAVILGMVCGYSDAAITKTLTGVLDRK